MTEAATMNIRKLKPAIEYILTAPANVDGVDVQLDAAWAIYGAEVMPSSVIAMISDNERLKVGALEDLRLRTEIVEQFNRLTAENEALRKNLDAVEKLIHSAMRKEASHD